MEPRLSFVTLGVENVARSRAFYEALGFKASAASNASITFFDAGGIVLALFTRCALAADAQISDSHPGFSGLALAHNVASEAAVDQVIVEAVAAGARLLKPGQQAFWGGYSGYFADPDGHIWEVAYNPFFPLDDARCVTLPAPVDHDAYSDDYLAAILNETRTIALIGASPKADRPSFRVMQVLLRHGYKVIPINPGLAGQEIHGQLVYASLAGVPGPVDMLDVFRNSDAVPGIVQDAIGEQARLKLKVIWMQLDVRHDGAAQDAAAHGFKVVMNRCPAIEIPRLGIAERG